MASSRAARFWRRASAVDETRVGGEGVVAEDAAKGGELLVGGDVDGDPLVVTAGGVCLVGGVPGVGVAEGGGDTAVHAAVQQELAEDGEERLGEGHLDLLALARALAVTEGHGDREGAVDAGDGVGGENIPDEFGLAVGVAAQKGVADGGLGVHAEAAVVAVRAVEAEGGHAQHDDVGVDLAEGLVTDARLGHRLGHVVLDEDIALGDQAAHGLLALGRHDVAGHGALVTGADVEAGVPVPGVVAGIEAGVGPDRLAVLGDAAGLLSGDGHLRAARGGLDAIDGLDAHDLGAPIGE